MFLNHRHARSLGLLSLLFAAAGANAATTYVLTLTNGGPMPISPAVIYAKSGQTSLAQIGATPSTGFIQLCQTGNPAVRAMEVEDSGGTTSLSRTTMPILPGESRELEVVVNDPATQSIHFEAMYGKTKDLCALGSIGSHSLVALKQHVTGEFIGTDQVVGSGAFLDPALPEGMNYLDPRACQNEMDAVSCLRSLALTNPGAQKIRFFASYLSGVQMLLENRYGASETQSLILPSSGAVQLRLKLKH